MDQRGNGLSAEGSDGGDQSSTSSAADRAPWSQDPVEVLRVLYPALLSLARIVGPAGRAEDLAQEALVRVLSRHPDFAGIDHPLGYTKTVLLRIAQRGGPRHRVEVPVGLQETLDRPGREQPEQSVVDRQTLLSLLLRLGRRQRACVYLRYIEGLDDEQIAAVLGCRASTVRSQVARGLRAMRPFLEEADAP